MKKRKLLCFHLIMLLILLGIVTRASAQETVIYIDPEFYKASEVGITFTVNVSIVNVTNLCAYHIVLWYNTTLLDGVKVELPPNHFLTPSEPNNIFTMNQIKDDYNTTHGAIGIIAILLNGEPPKNGSGILVTITFKTATLGGPSPLKLYFPGFAHPVQLVDSNANFIACTAIDGTVEVVPEFPLFLLMPLLMAMTIVVIVFKMKFARNK